MVFENGRIYVDSVEFVEGISMENLERFLINLGYSLKMEDAS